MNKTTQKSLDTIKLCYQKAQFLEKKGLLAYIEKDLTRIARDLEEYIDDTLSDLYYDARSTDLSVGQDYTYTAESLEEYKDNFGN